MAREFRVVRLLEPELCLKCRFGKKADVVYANGNTDQMINCTRLDCDNWDNSKVELAIEIKIRPD